MIFLLRSWFNVKFRSSPVSFLPRYRRGMNSFSSPILFQNSPNRRPFRSSSGLHQLRFSSRSSYSHFRLLPPKITSVKFFYFHFTLCPPKIQSLFSSIVFQIFFSLFPLSALQFPLIPLCRLAEELLSGFYRLP